MLKETEKWSYSFDGEVYEGCDFSSSEEAAKVAREELEARGDDIFGAIVYIGKVQEYSPVVDADDVLERIQGDAYDLAGEYAEDYLDGPGWRASEAQKKVWKEQREKLTEMLTSAFLVWAKETDNEPRFFVVDSNSAKQVILE